MRRKVITEFLGSYVQPPPRRVAESGPPARAHSPQAPLDLHLETDVISGRQGVVRRRRFVTWPCSVALHAAGALAMIAIPLLLTEALPEVGGLVHAFFVDPMLAPPPPPPPPPPAVRPRPARAQPQAPIDRSERFTAPVSIPEEVRPEDGLDLGIEGGVPGGVEGGVPGGVVGGVVGGLPQSLSRPPPPVAPLRVGGHVKEPVKLKHVDPVYPKLAADASVRGVVILEAVIDATGRVTQATVLRGVPLLDEAALTAVRQWEYSPTLVDGIPTPIVLVITVVFQIKGPPGD